MTEVSLGRASGLCRESRFTVRGKCGSLSMGGGQDRPQGRLASAIGLTSTLAEAHCKAERGINSEQRRRQANNHRRISLPKFRCLWMLV